MQVGIDLMGSENSPDSLLPAVERAAQHFPHVTFFLFADQSTIDLLPPNPNIQLVLCPDNIRMDDEPVQAIRQKKESSLVKAIHSLKRKEIDAFVTAGNTGALIAGATLLLPLLPNIKRAALLATLPTQNGLVSIVDVGGNVSSKSFYLLQYAEMGLAYHECCLEVKNPRLGLLNIGTESKKGTIELRQIYEQLKQRYPSQFIGNIEGRDVFNGSVDVLVTNGFAGNVLLKTAEGVYSYILDKIEKKFSSLLKENGYEGIKAEFDYSEYSGAIVCGIEGIAIKCHGQSSARAFYNGIQGAVHLVQNNFIRCLKNKFLV